MITLRENGYVIALAPVFTQTAEKLKAASAVEIQNHKENKIDSDRALSIKDAAEASNTTTIRYADVFSSVDVEYLLSGNDIKENIIVNNEQNEYNPTLRRVRKNIGFRPLICMMLMAKYPMMYPTSC